MFNIVVLYFTTSDTERALCYNQWQPWQNSACPVLIHHWLKSACWWISITSLGNSSSLTLADFWFSELIREGKGVTATILNIELSCIIIIIIIIITTTSVLYRNKSQTFSMCFIFLNWLECFQFWGLTPCLSCLGLAAFENVHEDSTRRHMCGCQGNLCATADWREREWDRAGCKLTGVMQDNRVAAALWTEGRRTTER